MKKSTALKIAGIIILVGVFLWYVVPYQKSLNNISIHSAEKGMGFYKEGQTNRSALEKNTVSATKEQLYAKDNDQLKQDVNSLIKEQARGAFGDLKTALWDFVLKPMLFLAFFVGLPVGVFQAIRKNVRPRKLFEMKWFGKIGGKIQKKN